MKTVYDLTTDEQLRVDLLKVSTSDYAFERIADAAVMFEFVTGRSAKRDRQDFLATLARRLNDLLYQTADYSRVSAIHVVETHMRKAFLEAGLDEDLLPHVGAYAAHSDAEERAAAAKDAARHVEVSYQSVPRVDDVKQPG